MNFDEQLGGTFAQDAPMATRLSVAGAKTSNKEEDPSKQAATRR